MKGWTTRNNLGMVARRVTGARPGDRLIEVGVQQGLFAVEILKKWPFCYDGVDPYVVYAGSNYDQATHERFYREACAAIAPFGDRATIYRRTSDEMADAFAVLDNEDQLPVCVYLDAAHDYLSVVDDISSWWPVIRSGGILAGHDYADFDLAFAQFRVKKAVDEFVAGHKLELHLTTDDPMPSWLLVKP